MPSNTKISNSLDTKFSPLMDDTSNLSIDVCFKKNDVIEITKQFIVDYEDAENDDSNEPNSSLLFIMKVGQQFLVLKQDSSGDILVTADPNLHNSYKLHWILADHFDKIKKIPVQSNIKKNQLQTNKKRKSMVKYKKNDVVEIIQEFSIEYAPDEYGQELEHKLLSPGMQFMILRQDEIGDLLVQSTTSSRNIEWIVVNNFHKIKRITLPKKCNTNGFNVGDKLVIQTDFTINYDNHAPRTFTRGMKLRVVFVDTKTGDIEVNTIPPALQWTYHEWILHDSFIHIKKIPSVQKKLSKSSKKDIKRRKTKKKQKIRKKRSSSSSNYTSSYDEDTSFTWATIVEFIKANWVLLTMSTIIILLGISCLTMSFNSQNSNTDCKNNSATNNIVPNSNLGQTSTNKVDNVETSNNLNGENTSVNDNLSSSALVAIEIPIIICSSPDGIHTDTDIDCESCKDHNGETCAVKLDAGMNFGVAPYKGKCMESKCTGLYMPKMQPGTKINETLCSPGKLKTKYSKRIVALSDSCDVFNCVVKCLVNDAIHTIRCVDYSTTNTEVMDWSPSDIKTMIDDCKEIDDKLLSIYDLLKAIKDKEKNTNKTVNEEDELKFLKDCIKLDDKAVNICMDKELCDEQYYGKKIRLSTLADVNRIKHISDADGNCLWHSLVYELKNLDSSKFSRLTKDNLRIEIAEHADKQKDVLQLRKFTRYQNEEIHFKQLFKKNGAWAQEAFDMALCAFQDKYKLNIFIFAPDEIIEPYKSSGASIHYNHLWQETIYLIYTGSHFNATDKLISK